jgi:membrane fusion protein (multidrug efflux system)
MNAVSRRDIDNAVARRDAAKEEVQAAKQRVQAAEGGVKAAEGQVEAAKAQVEFAKIKLGYTKVYAPVSGLIGQTKAQIGDLVGRPPNVVLDTISNVDPIFVEFSMNEREYLDLARRMTGRTQGAGKATGLELVLADGSTYSEKGAVNFANRQVDPTTGTILIQASFPNRARLLRPGQFARVRGVLDTKLGALLVPQKAVQELQGQYQVFVVGAGDKVEVRNVKMGQKVGELWVADEGLKPGDRVIVDGLQRLKADMVVAPKPVPPPSEAAQPPAPPAPAPEAPATPAKTGH